MELVTVTNTRIPYLSAKITYFKDADGLRGDIELIEQLGDSIKTDILTDFMFNQQGNLHLHNAGYLYFETPAYAYFWQGILKAIYQIARQAPHIQPQVIELFMDEAFKITSPRYLTNIEIVQRIAHLLEFYEFNFHPVIEIFPRFMVNLDVEEDEFEERALELLEDMYRRVLQAKENDELSISPKELKAFIKRIYNLLEDYRLSLVKD